MANNLYDLVIIGSGPAGISAAIYAGRARLRAVLVDSGESGGQIRITSEVVNYPGIEKISGAELSDTMRRQAESFGVKTMYASVESVDFSGDLKKIRTSKGELQAVGVIIATGARPRRLGFVGEDEYQGRGVGYCATCDGEFFTGLDVFVIGAGFAAAEEAIFLTRYARKVYVIAREPAFTCSKSIADQVLAHPKIEVRFQTEIVSATGDDTLKKAVFRDNAKGTTWEYTADEGSTFGIFVFVGYEPMSQLFQDKVKLDDYGYIPTDEDLQTNVPGVYAAGDIRPKKLRQLVTAVSDGAIAATCAEKYIEHKKAELCLQIEPERKESKPKAGASILTGELAEQLAPVLERFEKPVQIVGIQKPNDALSEEIATFLRDLAALSDKLQVRLYEQGEQPELEQALSAGHFPLMALLEADGTFSGVSYHAVPGGHEFNSFILALYNVAGPGQTVPPELLARIQALKAPVHLQVGMSLSCTMCPDTVQAAQLIALHNPAVRLDVIDVTRYPDFRNEHKIMSVPAVVVNGKHLTFGKKNTEQLLDYLQQLA